MSKPGLPNYSMGVQLLNVCINCYLNKKSALVPGVVITVLSEGRSLWKEDEGYFLM